MTRNLLAITVAASLSSSAALAADDVTVLLEVAAGTYHATMVANLDNLPERSRANRIVIPAAFATADGKPSGLAVAGGTRLSHAAWPDINNLDGGVLIDSEGHIHLEHVDAFEHEGAVHALRQSEDDFHALTAKVSGDGTGFFQTLMWIDGGEPMLGDAPPAALHRRTTLAETADGTLMVVSTGTRSVGISAHVEDLLALGAHDAVAVDPPGFFCWREIDGNPAPCGPLASSYLVIDYD